MARRAGVTAPPPRRSPRPRDVVVLLRELERRLQLGLCAAVDDDDDQTVVISVDGPEGRRVLRRLSAAEAAEVAAELSAGRGISARWA